MESTGAVNMAKKKGATITTYGWAIPMKKAMFGIPIPLGVEVKGKHNFFRAGLLPKDKTTNPKHWHKSAAAEGRKLMRETKRLTNVTGVMKKSLKDAKRWGK